MSRDVGIGIVGYGMMGRAHAYGYRVAPQLRELPVQPRLRVISGRDAAAVARAARRATGSRRRSPTGATVVEHPDVDIVDVCTPPGTHAEVVEAAVAAGKAVLCEKPLAADLRRRAPRRRRAHGRGGRAARDRLQLPAPAGALADEAARRRGSDRRGAAVARRRGSRTSSSIREIPFDWRFERALGGTTIADLGAHLVDLALWIVGDVDGGQRAVGDVHADAHDPTRPPRAVDVDEASSALLRFASGARGTLELARVAPRRPCDFTVEVNGARGTLHFDYARLNELWLGDAADEDVLYGLRRIRAEHRVHPYARRLVADRPGRRLRRVVREPGRRPARALARRPLDAGSRAGRARAGGLRGDGARRGRGALGPCRRSDRRADTRDDLVTLR